jgi:hypothetical protein
MPKNQGVDPRKRRIEYIDDGIGFTMHDGVILLNKNLKKYPLLHKAVIDHEIGHKDYKNLDEAISDTWYDMNSYNPDLAKFCLTHPKALTAFFPLRRYKGEYQLNLNLAVIYLVLLTLAVGGVYLLITGLKWLF